MTREERNTIISRVRGNPVKTYEEIAAKLGVSKSTVLRAVRGVVSRSRGKKLNLNRKQK